MGEKGTLMYGKLSEKRYPCVWKISQKPPMYSGASQPITTRDTHAGKPSGKWTLNISIVNNNRVKSRIPNGWLILQDYKPL